MTYESYDQDMLDMILTSARKRPVGSRHSDAHNTYTVVALRLVGVATYPILLADRHLASGDNEFVLPQEVGPLAPSADDPETADRARAMARQARESITQYGNTDVLWDTPTSTAQIDNALRFAHADREWRIAQSAQEKAAEERALAIARVAWDAGNQSEAGRLLGLDQSRVSRAVETARRLTGGDTT